MKRRILFLIVISILTLVMIRCAPSQTLTPTSLSPDVTSPPPEESQFELTSGAFQANHPIPIRYSCHGENLSPHLSWIQPPGGTQSFVLVMDDPDAVEVAGFVWDHWLLFNIPADVNALAEGVSKDSELTDGSRHGKTSFKRLGYGGPCPPSGQTHGYVFTLYALDTTLELDSGASKEEIFEAMNGHILAQAQLIGMYTSP